ncbi:MAG: hypothetical protein U0176_26705 [Bacteroidia bacterium]
MEPHSEQRGSLRDKFEGFEQSPSDAVWDRIADTPTDRPLGAKFRAFTWEPNPRVWRGIVAALHPATRRRVWVWSAAASVALVAGLTWMLSGTPEAQPAMHLAESCWDINSGIGGDLVAFHDAHRAGHGANASSMNLADASSNAQVPGSNSDDRPKATPHNRTNDPRQGGLAANTRPDRGHRDPKSPSNHSPKNLSSANNSTNPTTFAGNAFASLNLLDARRLSTLPLNFREIQRRVTQQQSLNAEIERMNDPRWAELPVVHEEEEAASAEANLYAQAGSSVGAPSPRIMEANSYDQFGGVDSFGLSAIPLSVTEERSNQEVPVQNYLPPVSVGFSLDHSLGKRFGLTAGLVYTRMRSYMDFASSAQLWRVDLTRHYLGLNLGGTYNVSLGKRLGAYATAGLKGDLGLGMQAVSDASSPGFSSASPQRQKAPAGNYLSGNVGLGMRFALVPRVSFYVQRYRFNYLSSQDNLSDQPHGLAIGSGRY